MRAKPVTLASVNKKLTGPPEGYNRKKELQVKHWLIGARTAESAGAPDIVPEPSTDATCSLDEVYHQLRDSTKDVAAALQDDSEDESSAKAVLAAPEPDTLAAGAVAVAATTAAGRTDATVVGSPADTYAGTLRASSQAQAASQQLGQETKGTAVFGAVDGLNKSTFDNRGAADSVTAQDVAAADAATMVQGTNVAPAISTAAAQVSNVLPAQAQIVSQQQLSAPAAAICHLLSGADAGHPVDSTSEVQLLNMALVQARQEHQDYMEHTRVELAAARAAGDAARSHAQSQVGDMQSQLAGLHQRLAGAEAEAASARAAGVRVQQEAKRQLLEAEDAAVEQAEQIEALRQQLQRVTSQMAKQANMHEQAVKQLQQQLQQARQQVAASQREMQLTRSNAAVAESNLTTQLQSVKGQLLVLEQQHQELLEQLQQLKQAHQQEMQMRQTAQASEAHALEVAAERAQLFQALLQETRHSSNAAQRRARAAAVAAAGVQQPASTEVADADTQQRCRTLSAQNTNIRASKAAQGEAGGSVPPDNAAGQNTGVLQQKQARKQLQRGLAADRNALAEVMAAQRRATAAAELEESQKVQQMLAAAPESLRALGLAYRAYVLVIDGNPAPCSTTTANAGNDSDCRAGVSALLQQLSKDYRLFLDQGAVAAPETSMAQTPRRAASNISNLSAAVLGLSASLIVLLSASTSTQQAHNDPCLGLLLEAASRNVPVVLVGPVQPEKQRAVLEAAASAASWSPQETSMVLAACKDRNISCSYQPSTVPTVARQVQQALGLTDLQLSLLPQAALKKLAYGKSKSGPPDLQHLSSPVVTHLKLDVAAMIAAAEQLVVQQSGQAAFDAAIAETAATQSKGAVTTTNDISTQSADAAAVAGRAAAAAVVLDLLQHLLVGNTMLRVLKLDNVEAAIAEATANILCNSYSVCLSLLTINGMSVPVQALLSGVEAYNGTLAAGEAVRLTEVELTGSTTASQHEALIASNASIQQQRQQEAGVLSEAQGVFLAVLLRLCTGLVSLRLPLLAADVPEAVVERLSDAVLQLPHLQVFNGMPLRCDRLFAAATIGNCGGLAFDLASHVDTLIGRSSPQKRHLSRVSTADSGHVLNMEGAVLGAVGAAVLGRSLLMAAESEGHPQAAAGILLQGCQVGVVGAKHLAAGLAALHGAHSKVQTGPNGRVEHLHTLSLPGNQLGPSGLWQLLRGLAAADMRQGLLQQLLVLDLGQNQLGDIGCQMLAEYCQHMGSLQVLGLAGNAISASGTKTLFGAIANSSNSSSSGGSSSARPYSDKVAVKPAVHQEGVALQVLGQLRVLQLGSNFIGDSGAAALAAALPRLPRLQQLELQDNYSIGSDGVKVLAGALAHAPSLTVLNLAKNNIGAHGAKFLAAGLRANAAAAAVVAAASNQGAFQQGDSSSNSFVGVQYLELEWCKLKTEGVMLLAEALTMGNGNTPGSTAAAKPGGVGNVKSSDHVARQLHCCLKRLGLSRNGAGDKGVKALVEALASNTGLINLDLRSNAIGLTGCRLLSVLLQSHNSTLRVLELAGNMENRDTAVLQALEDLAAADRASLMWQGRVPNGNTLSAGELAQMQ